jgi:hypothetical protein
VSGVSGDVIGGLAAIVLLLGVLWIAYVVAARCFGEEASDIRAAASVLTALGFLVLAFDVLALAHAFLLPVVFPVVAVSAIASYAVYGRSTWRSLMRDARRARAVFAELARSPAAVVALAAAVALSRWG